MENKTALITGAAKRIGRAIAISMAENGWNIAIHYNSSQNEAEDLLKYIRSIGVQSCIIQADLADETQARSIIPQAVNKLGTISCLVNNASAFKNDTIDNFTSQSWNENMAINLNAPAVLIQEFTKQLGEGQKGNVINMLDYAVLRYPERFMSYTTSKAALWALTQQLALSLAPQNIRVNGIGPGNSLPALRESEERFNRTRLSSPLGIGADPTEICNAVNFILSSNSMTGQIIALDGGKHLIGPEVY